ncbi:unnamed protein product [Hermetia illucens]|uniref:Uncharacterized protein n=1 Tax=Hermetia illucens TaxID=343691 RepID=A0A7R8V3N5_HERIL|nr:unnamed protein product [Hermetia illucens]
MLLFKSTKIVGYYQDSYSKSRLGDKSGSMKSIRTKLNPWYKRDAKQTKYGDERELLGKAWTLSWISQGWKPMKRPIQPGLMENNLLSRSSSNDLIDEKIYAVTASRKAYSYTLMAQFNYNGNSPRIVDYRR